MKSCSWLRLPRLPGASPLRRLLLLCVTCAGCVQMCGFEEGVPLVDEQDPTAGVVLDAGPQLLDASTAQPAPPDASPDAGCGSGPNGPDAAATNRCKCGEYCTRELMICGPATDPTGNYYDYDECMGLCRHYARGASADDNSFECRWARLGDATDSQEPAAACSASGRTGEGDGAAICGDKCAAYCQLAESVCPSEFQQEFRDAATCLAQCGELGHRMGFDPKPCSNGGVDERSGSTVECRLWHVGAAARAEELRHSGDYKTHCGHVIGKMPCQGAPSSCPTM